MYWLMRERDQRALDAERAAALAAQHDPKETSR
ncbi:hypothetical protein Taqua_02367 [Tepidimonas aquatica]|uniref:Uncharacterized protein n=1 Tax=Tepidimonas aquatica TaxID=247482 RepID=A0A554WAW8_9BURK|nr:hypothetical protein Taqua_02367 [Tepidimonas aquatica]